MPDSGRLRNASRLLIGALLVLNLALGAGQAAFGKQAALQQAGASPMDLVRNPWYLATLACLAGHALVWPVVLKWTPLGFAYAFTTLQYPVTLLVSRTIFGENVTTQNIAGSALIICGVLTLYRASTRTP